MYFTRIKHVSMCVSVIYIRHHDEKGMSRSQLSVVSVLVKYNVQCTLALEYAAFLGNNNIVRFLLSHNHAIEEVNALSAAASTGRNETVRILLDNNFNVNQGQDEPLLLATLNGHLDTVRILISAGANVNARDSESLIDACGNGFTDIVKEFLNAGANVHAQNDRALRLAAYRGYTDIVSILIPYTEYRKEEVLAIAKRLRHLVIVHLLEQ